MKQSIRKIFGAASAVFLIGLFVTAAPVRAASTDERIRALAAELNQLKAEQQRVKQEQSQIKADALAARSKLPRFRYRPGRGLSVRAADRSWEWRVRGENSMYLTFFPNGGRSLEDDNDGGPTQGGMFKRHQQLGNVFRLRNGLYEFGLNIKCDREGGNKCRESGGRMNVRFSTWSPYYPDLQVLDIRGDYSPLARVSSSGGHTIEREPSFTDFLSTGSSKGLGLHWSDVPVGPVNIAHFNFAYMSGGDQFNAPTNQDPLAQKGFFTQLGVEPFAKSKNKYLKGLTLGFSYVNVHDDDNREEGDNDQMRIRTRTRTNRATIFSMSTRGRHSYISPHVDYTVGPFNIGYTWSRNAGEQRRTGGCAAKGSIEDDIGVLEDLEDLGLGNATITTEIADLQADADASCNNFSDARITNNIIGGGVYVWGPKGFLSGSRNGGWRLSYTHNRIYIDAGSGFDADETENEFSDMRRWHYIENHIMLRWFQTRGIVWAILYEVNRVGKMKGSKKAEEARRRLNILEDGGYYQAISLHTKWTF